VGSSAAKSCLPPVVDADVRLLILGSLPGEASLAAERYYAHPRNGFWRLLETVLEEPLEALLYEARLARLLARGIGLWDTVASAERRGSLDGAMRAIAANPLLTLVAALPELRAVAFNGGTAARIGRREVGDMPLTLIDLPSSSPALTMPVAAKAERWAVLKPFTIDRS
jgi:hypoxanthine-DNA glycosylase